MTIKSLSNVLTGDFVTAISRAGTDTSSKSATAAALSGKASSVDLSTSLRLGARNFSYGLQALNVAISYVNVSHSIHERMGGLVDKMITLVEKAGKPGTGFQSERRYQRDFHDLAGQFSDLVDQAKVAGEDVLDMDTLTKHLASAGLSPSNNSDMADLFSHLTSLTKSHVDSITGETVSDSTSIPVDIFDSAVRRAKSAIAGGDESSPTFFSTVLKDLKSLKSGIDVNVKYLEKTTELIGKNMTLVRAAGLAFLDESDQIKGTEKADAVVSDLQNKIRQNAQTALSQAGNLQSIVVAGVTLVAASSSKGS